MSGKSVLLANCNEIDPSKLDDYLSRDGFKAFEKARSELKAEDVIAILKDSGLRGRGGAGFPCGVKWELAANTEADQRYLICNADEGEVGTFKDRYMLSHDPFKLIEGMAIAGMAIGATKAYLYLREEYRDLVPLLEAVITQVKEKGYLDHMELELFEGAGAYICGEESALMSSIEGGRGESRFKPPFPPTNGLFGKPTIINNVETLMNVPQIMLNGAAWFQSIGTEKSKGTKVFSVAGDVPNPGVYEMELGTTIRHLVTDVAGAEDIKAVQVGGASGRLVPVDQLDQALSFETVLGSGAITVFNQSRDIIDMVYQTIAFFSEESCGKCTPCREGMEVLMEILARFIHAEGEENDLVVMENLSETLMLASLCGLGQAAPNMLLDSLTHFRGDYENRVQQSTLLKKLHIA